ncbi:hypothetical protein [Actinoplanes awajinensis]|uniref:hypothetical protein n=1 Tax=Actinoplanes awajinensis TaxID=135946 RepID=UPI0012F9769D|nr:hypothetical protein [Actinoplanes awajinensis]
MFDRTSPLPEGVPRQVGFFFGGGLDCPGERAKPQIVLAAEPVIPSEFLLCVYGFRAGRVTLTIRPPAGKAGTATLRGGNGGESGWEYRYPLRPGAPAGDYRITARQGSRTATATIAVTYPETPRLWLDRPGGCLKPGDDVHIYLAGFPAGRTVMLNLYRMHDYQTSFPATTDAYGSGHAILRVDPGTGFNQWGVSHPALGDTVGMPYDPIVEGRISGNVFCTEAPPAKD